MIRASTKKKTLVNRGFPVYSNIQKESEWNVNLQSLKNIIGEAIEDLQYSMSHQILSHGLYSM